MFSIVSTGIFIFAFLIIYAQLSAVEKFGPTDKKGCINYKIIVFLAALAFIIRVFAAPYTSGHPTDMKCWTYWGSRLYSLRPQNFYAEGIFADYPPGYMYILWLIGSITAIFNLPTSAIIALYKLPAIISDIALALCIYNIAKKHWNGKIACILFFLSAFNPLSYFNSVIWGQMDSLLVLFTLMSLYALYEEKYIKSAVLILIATLLKPQALMFAPIYLCAFIQKKDIKLIAKTIIICLGLIVIIAYPFSPAHQENTHILLRLVKAINPFWLIDKYSSTLGSYNYASVNAFNFPALIGGNWKDASSPFLFLPWSIWGYVTILFAIVFSCILYFKAKDNASKIFVPAFFIIAFLFAFGTKMHERYIYPAIIFLIIMYIFSKKRIFLWLFTGLSTINLFNLEYVFYCATNNNSAPEQTYVTIISFIQILIILIALYKIYHIYYKKSNISEEKHENFFTNLSSKISRYDLLCIIIISAIYAIPAFVNLGDKAAPQTFETSDKASFTVKLDNETYIEKIAYYYGISDVSTPASFDISYSSNGKEWHNATQKCTLKSVFRWEYADLMETAKFIRFTPNTNEYSLGEIGFLSKNNEVIPIKSAAFDNGNSISNIFDEQNNIPIEYSYKNGTYFDEIYHARSAYELLNGLEYYETTHPPLGKILISFGISIFGMTPFGWRFMGTLFGLLMLPALYILLKKLFKRTYLATIGTILLASDFMHYSLTRIGTIDSFPVFFIIMMYLCMYTFTFNLNYNIKEFGVKFQTGKNRKMVYTPLLLCGISTGLGIASKWISIYSVIGIAALFFIELYNSGKSLGFKNYDYVKFIKSLFFWCILCFIIIPFVIYILSYIPVAKCQSKGLFEAMADSQKYMLSYHGNLKATHPYSSKWYEWPIIKRPLLTYYETFEENHAAITIMGNPVLWWTGIAAFIYSVYKGIKTKSRTALFIIIGLLSQLLPWVFVTRCTFIYHFFASVPFMIMLIVYSIQELIKISPKYKYAALMFCFICILSFALFYPVLTGVEINNNYTNSILKWFDCWIF